MPGTANCVAGRPVQIRPFTMIGSLEVGPRGLLDAATDTRLLDRFETLTTLLLTAGTAAASLNGSAASVRDRNQVAKVSAAVDAALVELRAIMTFVPDSVPAGRAPARRIVRLPRATSPGLVVPLLTSSGLAALDAGPPALRGDIKRG